MYIKLSSHTYYSFQTYDRNQLIHFSIAEMQGKEYVDTVSNIADRCVWGWGDISHTLRRTIEWMYKIAIDGFSYPRYTIWNPTEECLEILLWKWVRVVRLFLSCDIGSRIERDAGRVQMALIVKSAHFVPLTKTHPITQSGWNENGQKNWRTTSKYVVVFNTLLFLSDGVRGWGFGIMLSEKLLVWPLHRQ